MGKIIVRIFLAILCFAVVFYCIYLMSTGELTQKENGLFGVLLTIFSTLASWVISHVYAESSYDQQLVEIKEAHQSNLKTYALKAAEKVNNLSNELSRLSTYLQQSLSSEFDNLHEENVSLRERLESSVHLIFTLKSVNDTALSDWKGVIGEELEQQNEEREEQEAEIKEILERVEHLETSQYEDESVFFSDDRVRYEMLNLKNELREAVLKMGAAPVAVPVVRKKSNSKEDVKKPCLACGSEITYRQRPKVKSNKAVVCKNCNAKYISKWEPENGFVVAKREEVNTKFDCPECKANNELMLDNSQGSSKNFVCSQCNSTVKVSRGAEVINLKVIHQSVNSPKVVLNLTEEMIEKIKCNLPQQPWEPGTHNKIAQKLGLSGKLVQDAITILIERGLFQFQFNGKLYVPADGVSKVTPLN